MASTSRDRNDEATYEAQNDQRLDDLHSKIRSLRGVTGDIYDDVERQNLMLDDTGNSFSSFGSSLTQSARNAARTFGLGSGGTKQWRIIIYTAGGIVGLWLLWRIAGWWMGAPEVEPPPSSAVVL